MTEETYKSKRIKALEVELDQKNERIAFLEQEVQRLAKRDTPPEPYMSASERYGMVQVPIHCGANFDNPNEHGRW